MAAVGLDHVAGKYDLGQLESSVHPFTIALAAMQEEAVEIGVCGIWPSLHEVIIFAWPFSQMCLPAAHHPPKKSWLH